MVFRYLFRRQTERFDRKALPPEYCEEKLRNGGYDYISEMSEWHAFRCLFFPMSVIREMDPRHLRELKRLTEKVLADTESKRDEDKSSA